MERLHKVGFSKLTSVEKAIDILFSNSEEVNNEYIETQDSLNRILAADVKSTMSVPPFDKSAMDGYAVKAEDTFKASPNNPKYLRKIGKIEIGEQANLELKKGEAIRISTGAVIPRGADAVIKIEETEIEGDKVTIYNAVTPGKNVAKKGEDIKEGEILLKKGIQLKAEHIAMISSIGIKKVKVSKRPEVSVFSTGNELIEVGQPIEPNKIYNSNTPMISNLVRIYGGIPEKCLTLKDENKEIISQLNDSLNNSQLVVFTGGTSVGTKDLLPSIIKKEGKVLVHGVAMRPGEPILLGLVRDKIVICLPGTPVAAYVGFIKFVGPLIRKMMGCQKPDPRIEIKAKMAQDVPVSKMGYIHYLRVKYQKENGKFTAYPVRLKGSGIISSLVEADGIVEISPEQEGLKKGEEVFIKVFP
jgi:molybdenum cofactor synthesis domain-containing protein